MTKKDYSTPDILALEMVNHFFRGRSTVDRFWEKVARKQADECWNWLGAKINSGYGTIGWTIKGRGFSLLAHQFSYMIEYGSIDRNLTIDHLCKNILCVNPSHLEQVPIRINVLRGNTLASHNANKTHCLNGHPFDESNTYIFNGHERRCRICQLERSRKFIHPLKTHCPEGHLYTPETARYYTDGRIRCLICHPPQAAARGPRRKQGSCSG